MGMTNNSTRLSGKWQIIAWIAFTGLFVVFLIYSTPESTWNVLCNAAVVLGHVCDAPNIAMSEQPEAKIGLLIAFALMLTLLILMTFAAMMILNWIVENKHGSSRKDGWCSKSYRFGTKISSNNRRF